MKKFKNKIEKLGLNFNLEILYYILAFVIPLLIIPIVILYKLSLIYIVLSPILNIFIFYFLISRYESIKLKKEEKLLNEFINVFSYFKIYVSNNINIYKSIELASKYSKDELNKYFVTLIEEINKDKTIKPFINFSSNFKNKTVEEVMIIVYQLIDEGNNEKYLERFNQNFNNLRNLNYKNKLEAKANRLTTNINLSITGSAYIILVLVIAVVNLIGRMTNGI